MKRAYGLHPDSDDSRSERFAREFMGGEWCARRQDEIDALPTKEWKGRTLYTIRCQGVRGKGPHAVHVPKSLLWQIVSLTDYFCVYHAADRLLRFTGAGAERRTA